MIKIEFRQVGWKKKPRLWGGLGRWDLDSSIPGHQFKPDRMQKGQNHRGKTIKRKKQKEG